MESLQACFSLQKLLPRVKPPFQVQIYFILLCNRKSKLDSQIIKTNKSHIQNSRFEITISWCGSSKSMVPQYSVVKLATAGHQ